MPQAAPDFFKLSRGEAAAEAPEIVWLHGWGQSHAALLPLAETLRVRARSLLYDLPGFGRTPQLAPGAGSEDYATALAEELGEPSASGRVLIGHSFGCRIALRLAAARPDLVAALVLIAPAGLPRKRSLVWRARAASLRALGRLCRLIDRLAGSRLHARFARRFGSADYRKAGPLRETFVKVVNEDLSEIAGHIGQPVAIIVGADDRETPPEISRRYAALIADARLSELAGYGHLDILSRGRHQVEARIARFLQECGFGE